MQSSVGSAHWCQWCGDDLRSGTHCGMKCLDDHIDDARTDRRLDELANLYRLRKTLYGPRVPTGGTTRLYAPVVRAKWERTQ